MKRIVWLVMLALLGAGTAMAQSRPRNDTGLAPLAPLQAATAGAGLRVYVDPETHEITSKPADNAQRRRAARKLVLPQRNDDLMWIEHRPDGSGLLHTQGQVMMNAAVHPGADGTLEEVCVPGVADMHTEPTP